ncbi:hypothetical protein ACTWJ8_32035 [Streptomyces sp. SDT5-1]|uniref:hypothetical protein n=1 Tax=Streptomyces sp. SDT5-1 TaxID=3406418 RepID=UPI003FD50DA6
MSYGQLGQSRLFRDYSPSDTQAFRTIDLGGASERRQRLQCDGSLRQTVLVAEENQPLNSEDDDEGPRTRTGDVTGTFVVGNANGINDDGVIFHVTDSSMNVTYSDGASIIESADEALKRGAEPEIVNEVLAGGAVAASFTALTGIAKAKMEATTQRRKNDQDTETERLRIESNERIEDLRAMRPQAQSADAEPDA